MSNFWSAGVTTFVTTDYAQMRRCRMAHLYAETVNEIFESGNGMVPVNGYVQSVRPDLTQWPLTWTVTIMQQLASAPTTAPGEAGATEAFFDEAFAEREEPALQG